MQPVKKFALIVDGRSHQDKEHWDLFFYSLEIRPDANICVRSAKEALDLLSQNDKPGTPQVGGIVLWNEPPTSNGMDMFVELANDKLTANKPFVILSPNNYINLEKLTLINNFVTFRIINVCETPHQRILFAKTLNEELRIG